jgi:AcrR family transcriptional regulator
LEVVHTNPSPGRVERKRQERTAAILDEAMAILAAEGLEALTLGRLARSFDLVPAALYRYFASKDALVAALQRRSVEVIHGRVGEALGSVDATRTRAGSDVVTLARLVAAARAYLALPSTDPEAAFLAALLLGDPRPLVSDDESRRTAPLLAAVLGDVSAAFQSAVASGALCEGDTTERTLVFWAVVHGALSLEKARRIAPALPSSSDVGRSAVATLLVGWGASRATVARADRLAHAGRAAEEARTKTNAHGPNDTSNASTRG